MTEPKTSITFSLRTRMTVVMTLLLLLTLATLQYQNNRAQHQVQQVLTDQKQIVTQTIDRQNQDIIAAANVGLSSLSDSGYLYKNLETKYLNAFDRDRVRHILVVKQDGIVEDASEMAHLGKSVELPAELREEAPRDPVPVAGPRGRGAAAAANRRAQEAEEESQAFFRPFAVKGDVVATLEGGEERPSDTYWFGARTTKGKNWNAVVVSTEDLSNAILRSQQQLGDVIERTAAQRLQATVFVFVLAVALMILLVWRFTRPIRKLSYAAERVARGELNFETGIRRRDEIGQLSKTFDAMIQQLRAKSQLEERLNNAERAAVIGRLTGAIAHEIRNPLNYINLSIDHVRSKFAPPEARDREKFERLLGSVKEELARLNRLVTDVLNFGRPANLNFRTVDLRDTVESVLGLVRQQAEDQGVAIDVRLPSEPASVEADGEKLKSCFSNIVINALQAMGGGGKLGVTVEKTADGFRTTFCDTGVGIPEDALDRVFEPYYSTKDTGTGLGLAVTKKLVDEHGGRVNVSSVVGEGTTFEVVLPISRGDDEKPAGGANDATGDDDLARAGATGAEAREARKGG